MQKGDVVLILEAMKMEILITAPVPGKVVSILCKEGEKVRKGAVLAVIGQNGLEKLPYRRREIQQGSCRLQDKNRRCSREASRIAGAGTPGQADGRSQGRGRPARARQAYGSGTA